MKVLWLAGFLSLILHSYHREFNTRQGNLQELKQYYKNTHVDVILKTSLIMGIPIGASTQYLFFLYTLILQTNHSVIFK